MKTLNIEGTDIYMEDIEDGRGKITISDSWRGAYTHFWGAMGSNISKFLCDINADYFADKLCTNTYKFSGKKSVKNVRKYIREEMSYDLPWYEFMSAQKELRKKLKAMESCSSANEFVDRMSNLHNELYCLDLSYDEEKEFLDIIKSHFACEPWNFIQEEVSNEYVWLCNIHKKLKVKLNA